MTQVRTAASAGDDSMKDNPDAAEHVTKCVHEWQAHGLVHEQKEARSPCSRWDYVLWTAVYAVQSCRCGKVKRTLVANQNERRRGDDLRKQYREARR